MQDFVPAHDVDPNELIDLPEALDAMPQQQRKALLLREWQGLSYKEIAEELDLSQAAVETLLFRARRSLAAGLGEEPERKSALGRLRAGGDAGSAIAILKSLLFTGGAKVAATVATVAATSVVAATPVTRHAVEDVITPGHDRGHAPAHHIAGNPGSGGSPATPRATSHVAASGVHAAANRLAHGARTRAFARAHRPVSNAVLTPAASTFGHAPPAVDAAAPVAAPTVVDDAPAPAAAPGPAAPIAPAQPAPSSSDAGTPAAAPDPKPASAQPSTDNGNGRGSGDRSTTSVGQAVPPAVVSAASRKDDATDKSHANGKHGGTDDAAPTTLTAPPSTTAPDPAATAPATTTTTATDPATLPVPDPAATTTTTSTTPPAQDSGNNGNNGHGDDHDRSGHRR
jgi:hypothetical protein